MTIRSINTSGLPQGVLTPMGDLLFAASEPGAWYDPSDMSTLFQDSAGTVPVTAVEQPVGRILDKSGRGNHATQATTTKRPVLSRRVNLLTKTEQFDDAAVWYTKNATYSSVIDAERGSVKKIESTGGRTGVVWTTALRTETAHANTISWILKAGTASRVIVLAGNSELGAELAVDNPSINPSYVFDLLTGGFLAAPHFWVSSQNLGGGWHKVSINIPAGSGLNQYFSGASLTLINGTSNVMPSGASVLIHSASCVRSTDSHLPYQRVNTATDYDADPNKFPAYLACDGIDDAMQTGNIDFTGTDKMTVWAGVTKLSDAGMQIITELGASFGNVGSFALRGPTSAAANNFGAPINTGAIKEALSGIASAPVSAVLSGVFDGAGDPSAYLRVGGVQTASGAGASGAAKFLNQSLHIGARAGSSFYFNGRIYSLIVRGAQSSLSQIEAAELHIRGRMKL